MTTSFRCSAIVFTVGDNYTTEKNTKDIRDIGYMERCDEGGGEAEEGVVHKKLQVYCICSCVRVVQI